ncbi:iron-containing alcohol dehydrogenase [Streptomyces canus]|uniref:iron-containing alcohol dehydrogenase n=1 Tax=Streptomyces canus TaxID=58343 RepID=UPI002E375CEB|nr:iron-containing alcohol dehydrogenase [Streptomyces canus]
MAGPRCGHRAHGGPPTRSFGPAPGLPGRRRGRSPGVRPRLGRPPLRRGRRGPAIARAHGTDVVVGLGGGSALDAAKAVAVAVGLEARVREVIGVAPNPRAPVLPLVAVLTNAGAGPTSTRVSYGCERPSGSPPACATGVSPRRTWTRWWPG